MYCLCLQGSTYQVMVIADAMWTFVMYRYDMVNVEVQGDEVYMGWSFDGAYSHQSTWSGTLNMNSFELTVGNYPEDVDNAFCLVTPADEFNFSKIFFVNVKK